MFVFQLLAERNTELECLSEAKEGLREKVRKLEADNGALVADAKTREEVRLTIFFPRFPRRSFTGCNTRSLLLVCFPGIGANGGEAHVSNESQ